MFKYYDLVPLKFSNLNLGLNLDFDGQIEIQNCVIEELFVNVISGKLTLDNVTVGTQSKLDFLKTINSSTSENTILNLGSKILLALQTSIERIF